MPDLNQLVDMNEYIDALETLLARLTTEEFLESFKQNCKQRGITGEEYINALETRISQVNQIHETREL